MTVAADVLVPDRCQVVSSNHTDLTLIIFWLSEKSYNATALQQTMAEEGLGPLLLTWINFNPNMDK